MAFSRDILARRTERQLVNHRRAVSFERVANRVAARRVDARLAARLEDLDDAALVALTVAQLRGRLAQVRTDLDALLTQLGA